MSIPQNTLIGKTRKSIGNVEFSSWKGINVMKSKPITVANPRTATQMEQRAKLTLLVQIARQIPAAVKAGFVQQAVKQSAYNAFISYNIRNAFVPDTAPNINWDPSLLLVSKGTIQSTKVTTGAATAGNSNLMLSWGNESLKAGQSMSDKLCVVLYNPSLLEWEVQFPVADRLSTQYNVITDLIQIAGETLHVYTFFYSYDGKKTDTSTHNSVFIG